MTDDVTDKLSTLSPIGAYRNDGPDTMHEGAQVIADQLPTLRNRVLTLYQQHGEMTDTEMIAAFRRTWGEGEYRSLSTRRRELVDAGLIEDSGRRHFNPATRCNNIIWRCTPRRKTDDE